MARRLFSEKFRYKIGRKLESTKLKLSAEQFLGISILFSAGVTLAIVVISFFLGWLLIFLAPLAAIVSFVGISQGLLTLLAQRRAAELERALPDALHQMASTLRAGVGIDSALEDIARSNYGELSLEFERVITEVNKGRPLINALLALSRRSCSSLYQRAFQLIAEGIERGAALANVLDSVASDVREVQAIQRERKAATTQQIMFLYAVALFAAPFIVGLTVGVSGVRVGGVNIGLSPEMATIAMIYNAVQAFICSLVVGLLRYGKISKGLAYAIPFMIVATVVFVLAGYVINFLAPKSI
ncbi:MAG: type II secretion system F family protein [Candidatus Hadarchaeum sp.]